jgi:hypothetical protein
MGRSSVPRDARSLSSNSSVSSTSETVPEKEALKLGKSPLLPLDYSFGIVAQRGEKVALLDAIKRQAKATGSKFVVVYAIRRPG